MNWKGCWRKRLWPDLRYYSGISQDVLWSTTKNRSHDTRSPGSHSITTQIQIKKEVLGTTNHLLSVIRHGPHWKRRVQLFFYCCLCIRYRGNVSTEPLTSNGKGIFTETSRCLATTRGFLSGRCLVTIRGFLPSRILTTIRGYTDTHKRTPTATWSHKPTIFFQNRKVG
jgi:hypothetical protein